MHALVEPKSCLELYLQIHSGNVVFYHICLFSTLQEDPSGSLESHLDISKMVE